MTHPCIPVEEMAAVARLPIGDPRRDHLESCPRCRAAHVAYLEFMEPGELPAEARAAEAGRRLDAALAEEVLKGPQRPSWGEDRGRERGRGRGTSLWARLASPILRPMWAAAAVALVVVGFLQLRGREPGPAELLRGEKAAVADPLATDARRLDGDEVRLEWTPVPGTEQAVVILYGADLTEVARVPAGGLRALTLPIPAPGAAPTRAPGAHAARYWRVLCLRGGQEIARSSMHELPGR